MKVTVENLEKNMAKITVEVDEATFEKAVNEAYNRSKSRFNIPGFRKGKVPRQMIEKMYGVEVFYEDAANICINQTYPEAYDESKLDIVSAPKIEAVQLEKGKTFIYSAEVAVKPEVKLGKYKGISITKVDTEVSDEELENAIKEELSRQGSMEVKEGKAENGDTVDIDFDGYVDGEQFEGGKAEHYSLKLGSNTFIPGFEDQLVGHAAGEDVDVNVTFPENYQAEDLAGKAAVFKCKIHEVKGMNVPELDDELVSDISEFSTVAEYKDDLKAKLTKTKEDNAKRAKEDEAVDLIIEASEMDIPDPMLDAQVENMINEFAQRIQAQGLSFEQYMQFSGMTVDSMKEQVKPEAIRRIQSTLVLEAIVAAEKIEATDDEFNTRMQEMADMYGMEVDKITSTMSDYDKDNFKKDIAAQKALDFVLENAKETAKKAAKKTTKKAEAEDGEEKPAKKPAAKKTTKKAKEETTEE